MPEYTIQQAAQATELSIATLRYYEREGLLRDIKRLSNGHRRYSDEDITWIEFLTCMRDSGMPIRDLKHYVDLCYQKGTGQERCTVLETHRDVLKAHMTMLASQLARIEEKIDWYHEALAKLAKEQESDET